MQTRTRVIIAHGWADDPNRGWIAWLVQALSARGIEAVAPAFPEPRKPDLERWLGTLRQVVGTPDEHTVLVGHSLGCFVLLRYLESLPDTLRVQSLILVAGFVKPRDTSVHSYFEPEPNWAKIRAHAQTIYSVYSSDDQVVTPQRSIELGQKLAAQQLKLYGYGHFAGMQGVDEVPELLELTAKSY